MEADLSRIGIDLRDYWRPKGGTSGLSSRRLLNLIDHLPRDAAIWPALAEHQKRTQNKQKLRRLRSGAARFREAQREEGITDG